MVVVMVSKNPAEWILRLPEIGVPIREKVKELEELQRRARELEALARRTRREVIEAYDALVSRVKGLWSPEEIKEAMEVDK